MAGPLTTNEVAWGLRVAQVGAVPGTYPAPVRFSAPRADAVWWAFRQPTSGVNSAYVAWTNGRTVVIRARQLLEADPYLSDLPSYDGRACGPMGPAFQAAIDDAMLRRAWAWLARARREGRSVVTQSLLDAVASSARSRSLSDAVAVAMILVGWHTGGLTGASFPSLMSPDQFFFIMDRGTLPRYGESMLSVDNATDFQSVALINNLDNLPASGYSQLDAWRQTGPSRPGSVSGPSTSSPSVVSPDQGSAAGSSPRGSAPATSSPATTSTPVSLGQPGQGGNRVSVVTAGSSSSPVSVGATTADRVPSVSFGSPVITPGVATSPRTELAAPGQTANGGSSVSTSDSSRDSSTNPSMLAGSIAEIAKKSWPYAVGAAGVVAAGFLVHHFVTKED